MKKSIVLFMMLGLAVPAMNGYAGAEDAGREVFEANRSGFEFTIPGAYKTAKCTLSYDDYGNDYSTDEGVLEMACTDYPMSEEEYDDLLEKESRAEEEGPGARVGLYPERIKELLKADESPEEEVLEAVYLGVKDYGKEKTNKENKENFLYRFGVDAEELILRIDNGTKDEEGNYDYPIQNLLKEGYRYFVTIEDGTVTSVRETGETAPEYQPRVQGTEGGRTVTNFLKTALMPVGTTLYIYGGGWDWQDTGSAVQARSFGVSPDWVRFFESQDENFTYKEKDGDETKADPEHSYYPYGEYNEYYYAGLDCSGFVGWVVYNTLETKEGEEGYVSGATGMAKKLYECGLGEWTQDIKAPDGKNGYEMKPGDVMSINGHVWISLGTCDDGSVVIVHSTPSKSRSLQPGGGVQISAVGTDESCEAYTLADRYMSEYYPAWYERYPVYLCDPKVYFTFEGENAGRFTWRIDGGGDGFTDPDGIREMKPAQVLELLFG